MYARSVVLAVLAAALAAGCGSGASSQKAYARRLAPTAIQPPAQTVPVAQRRELTIRVYADEAFQAQNLRWQQKVEQLVARANQVLGPAYGVTLKVEAASPWKRDAGDTDLDGMLTELETLDSGKDAAWIVGFVTALPQVTSSLHKLGFARPLGRHMILRGMNDTAERTLLDDVLESLPDAQREELYQQRKAHKELAVFLHEWGHTLGAIHTRGPGELMNPGYDASMQAFSAPNTQIIALGVRYRDRGGNPSREAARWNAALLELLQTTPTDDWVQQDYQQTLAFVAQGPQATPEVEVSGRLTPEGRRAFYRARDLADENRLDEAFREVLPLTEQYGDEPQVMTLGCRISARTKGMAYPTPALCEAAAALTPDDPTPLMLVAQARLDGDDAAGGLEALRAAHARLDAAATADPAAWAELAQHYQALQRVTWLEQALARAGETDRTASLRDWAGQTRRRYGLAPGSVPPEQESDYIDAIKQVLSLTYGHQYDQARAAANTAHQQFPRAAGPDMALCDLELRQGHAAPARRACERALERYDQAVWAMYLLASIDARDQHWPAATRHLERAMEIEPAMQPAWRLLAKVYERSKRDDALGPLRERYQTRFGEPL